MRAEGLGVSVVAEQEREEIEKQLLMDCAHALGPGEEPPRADPMAVFADKEAMDTRLEESEALYLKLLARAPETPQKRPHPHPSTATPLCSAPLTCGPIPRALTRSDPVCVCRRFRRFRSCRC